MLEEKGEGEGGVRRREERSEEKRREETREEKERREADSACKDSVTRTILIKIVVGLHGACFFVWSTLLS